MPCTRSRCRVWSPINWPELSGARDLRATACCRCRRSRPFSRPDQEEHRRFLVCGASLQLVAEGDHNASFNRYAGRHFRWACGDIFQISDMAGERLPPLNYSPSLPIIIMTGVLPVMGRPPVIRLRGGAHEPDLELPARNAARVWHGQ